MARSHSVTRNVISRSIDSRSANSYSPNRVSARVECRRPRASEQHRSWLLLVTRPAFARSARHKSALAIARSSVAKAVFHVSQNKSG